MAHFTQYALRRNDGLFFSAIVPGDGENRVERYVPAGCTVRLFASEDLAKRYAVKWLKTEGLIASRVEFDA